MVRRSFGPRLGLLVLLLLPLAAAACGDSPSSPSGYAPFSQVDLVFGDGATAETGKHLTINYNGWLYDPNKADRKGVQFASYITSGAITFMAGNNEVIAGWEKGVIGMKEGGLRRLTIPPSLGYGATRYTIVPPNVTTVFELE